MICAAMTQGVLSLVWAKDKETQIAAGVACAAATVQLWPSIKLVLHNFLTTE